MQGTLSVFAVGCLLRPEDSFQSGESRTDFSSSGLVESKKLTQAEE